LRRSGSFALPFLFEEFSLTSMKGVHMRKSFLSLLLSIAVLGLSACASTPTDTGNNPDAQRSRAHGAQDELSTAVRK
jgi:starvation-inducible outer membrane lipoprotein